MRLSNLIGSAMLGLVDVNDAVGVGVGDGRVQERERPAEAKLRDQKRKGMKGQHAREQERKMDR